MFYSDYHMHTNFSSDSPAPMEEMIQKAIRLGLREIAFTDHVDIDYPGHDYNFLVDYPTYRKTVEGFQEKYEGKINIRLGAEIGFQSHIKEQVAELYRNNAYDFVIGSTHCIEGVDLYYGEIFKTRTKDEAYTYYFEDLLRNVRMYDEFNVYGHLDYIDRYAPYPDKTLVYEDYKDLIDEILKTLIAKGKGVEINTSGFKYGLGHAHPQLPILKRYRELGGEIVTVGSDAHEPKHITHCFDKAYELLEAAGFRYITLFQNQQPAFLSLEKFKI